MEGQLVSICVPAYQKPDFVLRCLQSIRQQDYKNIEVIISDDSPNKDINLVADQFPDLAIKYIHNQPPLKSPANWNAAINKASGEFIMLMHQDDWLQNPTSISKFVSCFLDEQVDFAFCKNIGMDTEGKKIFFQDKDVIPDLESRPEYLVIRCVIGPPSNVMLRKRVHIRYDENLIWLVDVDYYIRLIKAGFKFFYIRAHLVTIGIHEDQTTEYVRSNNKIIFKENILVSKKLGDAALHDIELYDYYWRLIRNFHIRSLQEVEPFDVSIKDLIPAITKIILTQKHIPETILKTGIFSKSFMALSYLKWRVFK